jgi:SAM-dependent methyltransferase
MSAGGVRYDTIGSGYSGYRRADPRIAAAVHEALGDARTVVNVGAGTGSYEPTDRPVIPIEPSTAMASQRDPALPPAVLGVAESLPLADDTADAAMAVLTIHHWTDRRRGLAEMRRVARHTVVLFLRDPAVAQTWWLHEYFPATARLVASRETPLGAVADVLGPLQVRPVPIPAGCRDGFEAAYWQRPQAFLDSGVCAAMSALALIPAPDRDAGVRRLRDDLASGEWTRRHGRLLELDELDLGYRVVTART